MLGLVVLKGDRPPLTPAESRVLRAFCDQLALVLERDRLLRSATEAEVYRQTESVRRSLLAAVSHDLRSPLAAIKASVTDLLDEAPGTDGDRPARGARGDRRRDRPAERADRQPAGHVEDRGGHAPGPAADGRPGRDASRNRSTGCGASTSDIDVDVRIAPEAALVRADPVFLDRS